MGSCFSGIKWETLTYLERCEGNFASENERLINHKVLVQGISIVVVEKAFSLFKYSFHHVGTYIKLLLHVVVM